MDVQYRSTTRQDVVDLAARLAPALAERASAYDETDAFATEDFDDRVASGYTSITVPACLVGRGPGAAPASRASRPSSPGSRAPPTCSCPRPSRPRPAASPQPSW